MPHCAKSKKDILREKRKIAEEMIVSLITTYNLVIQKSFPKKMQDPGSFTIPCKIGQADMGKTLCDSRASINLMPLFVVKTLSLGGGGGGGGGGGPYSHNHDLADGR